MEGGRARSQNRYGSYDSSVRASNASSVGFAPTRDALSPAGFNQRGGGRGPRTIQVGASADGSLRGSTASKKGAMKKQVVHGAYARGSDPEGLEFEDVFEGAEFLEGARDPMEVRPSAVAPDARPAWGAASPSTSLSYSAQQRNDPLNELTSKAVLCGGRARAAVQADLVREIARLRAEVGSQRSAQSQLRSQNARLKAENQSLGEKVIQLEDVADGVAPPLPLEGDLAAAGRDQRQGVGLRLAGVEELRDIVLTVHQQVAELQHNQQMGLRDGSGVASSGWGGSGGEAAAAEVRGLTDAVAEMMAEMREERASLRQERRSHREEMRQMQQLLQQTTAATAQATAATAEAAKGAASAVAEVRASRASFSATTPGASSTPGAGGSVMHHIGADVETLHASSLRPPAASGLTPTVGSGAPRFAGTPGAGGSGSRPPRGGGGAKFKAPEGLSVDVPDPMTPTPTPGRRAGTPYARGGGAATPGAADGHIGVALARAAVEAEQVLQLSQKAMLGVLQHAAQDGRISQDEAEDIEHETRSAQEEVGLILGDVRSAAMGAVAAARADGHVTSLEKRMLKEHLAGVRRKLDLMLGAFTDEAGECLRACGRTDPAVLASVERTLREGGVSMQREAQEIEDQVTAQVDDVSGDLSESLQQADRAVEGALNRAAIRICTAIAKAKADGRVDDEEKRELESALRKSSSRVAKTFEEAQPVVVHTVWAAGGGGGGERASPEQLKQLDGAIDHAADVLKSRMADVAQCVKGAVEAPPFVAPTESNGIARLLRQMRAMAGHWQSLHARTRTSVERQRGGPIAALCDGIRSAGDITQRQLKAITKEMAGALQHLPRTDNEEDPHLVREINGLGHAVDEAIELVAGPDEPPASGAPGPGAPRTYLVPAVAAMCAEELPREGAPEHMAVRVTQGDQERVLQAFDAAASGVRALLGGGNAGGKGELEGALERALGGMGRSPAVVCAHKRLKLHFRSLDGVGAALDEARRDLARAVAPGALLRKPPPPPAPARGALGALASEAVPPLPKGGIVETKSTHTARASAARSAVAGAGSRVSFGQAKSSAAAEARRAWEGLPVHPRSPEPADLFAMLADHCKSRGTTREQLCRKYAASDAKATLELGPYELSKLVREFYPAVSQRELRHFTVMSDVDGNGRVRDSELKRTQAAVAAAPKYVRVAAPMGPRSGPTNDDGISIDHVLWKLAFHISDKHSNLQAVFSHCDKDKDGRLSPKELVHLLNMLFQGLSGAEKEHLLANLGVLDVTGDGFVNKKELDKGLKQMRHLELYGGPGVSNSTLAKNTGKGAAAIVYLRTAEELRGCLAGPNPVLVEFSLDENPASLGIRPVVNRLAMAHGAGLTFVRVDVDVVPGLVEDYQLPATLPTFDLFQRGGGTRLGRVEGAEPKRLQAMIEKHAPTAGTPQ